MALELDRSILFAAGAATLALAVLVLLLRPGRGINRALAALLAARGATILLPQVSDDPAWTWTAVNVQPYFGLALVPLALYCAYAFAREGGQPGRSAWRGAGWLAMAAIALLDLAYFVDHSLLQTLAPGTAAVGALQAAEGVQYVSFGPLWLLPAAAAPVLAYLGLRLALQYRLDPAGRQGPMLLFLAGGLAVGALFDGASRLAALTALLDGPAGFPWLPWGWAVVVLPVLGLVPALLAVAVVASSPERLRPQRGPERAILLLAGLAFFSGFLRLIAPADSDAAGDALVLVLLGLWRLAMPVLVTYALVRHASARPQPSASPAPAARAAARPPQALDRNALLR